MKESLAATSHQYGGALAADENRTVSGWLNTGSTTRDGATIKPTCPVPSLPFGGYPVANMSPSIASSGPLGTGFQQPPSTLGLAQSAATNGCLQLLCHHLRLGLTGAGISSCNSSDA